MPIQAIEQATCTECDGDTIDRTNRDISEASDDLTYITYQTECDDCGETGGVSITEDGLRHTDELDYEEATWNQEDEEEGDDDE